MDDICNCVGRPLGFHGKTSNRLYDKLFFGSNIPGVTPPGEFYRPAWSRRELRKLHQVFERGLRTVDAALADAR